MDIPPVPRSVEDVGLALDELVAQVDDHEVVMGEAQGSYNKCIEALWQAGHLVTEYMAHRLGMTPLQRSTALDRLVIHTKQSIDADVPPSAVREQV